MEDVVRSISDLVEPRVLSFPWGGQEGAGRVRRGGVVWGRRGWQLCGCDDRDSGTAVRSLGCSLELARPLLAWAL